MKMKFKNQLLCLISFVFICSNNLFSQKENKQNLSDKVIAVVNDETILLSEFEKVSQPMIEDYKKKNPDITDEKIKKFKETILNEMVNNKLIIQKSKKEKIPISKRQLDQQINNIKNQFGTESSFEAELRKENLTKEKFEERVKEQLMAEELTYREVTSNVTPPTQEEIDTLLKLIKQKLNGEKIEGLSEQENEDLTTLSKLINQFLTNKKTQSLYNKWVEKLRKEANIKINPIE